MLSKTVLKCHKKVNHIEKKQNRGIIPPTTQPVTFAFKPNTWRGSGGYFEKYCFELFTDTPPITSCCPSKYPFSLPFPSTNSSFCPTWSNTQKKLKCHINTKHYIMRSNVLKMYPQAGLPTLFAAAALILRGQSCSSVTLQSNASCRRPLTLVVLPRLHTTTTTTTTGLAWLQ